MEFPEIPEMPDGAVEGFAPPLFARAKGVAAWVRATFFQDDSPAYNSDHDEIQQADILFLWASYDEIRDGKRVAGTAQINRKQVKRWAQGLETFWFWEWNGGRDPDFVITLSAEFFGKADPVSKMAVVEHELFHCRHKRDQYGEPKFGWDDEPVWTIQGHDVEEFIGIVRRYGAFDKGLRDMRDALNAEPQFGRPECQAMCGCGAVIG